jgi:hypothetical protein
MVYYFYKERPVPHTHNLHKAAEKTYFTLYVLQFGLQKNGRTLSNVLPFPERSLQGLDKTFDASVRSDEWNFFLYFTEQQKLARTGHLWYISIFLGVHQMMTKLVIDLN